MRRYATLGVFFLLLTTTTASAMLLPRSHRLRAVDRVEGTSGVTEAQFNQVIDFVLAQWKDVARVHGAELVAVKRWADPEVNASAEVRGNKWAVIMYGGLARRPEMTPDALMLAVCHELGHHFAGYAFYSDWGSAEGESDYWATRVCARRILMSSARNERFRSPNMPEQVKGACDQVWRDPREQDLCYRLARAGYQLAKLLANAAGDTEPSFDRRDPNRVAETDPRHPAAQCRLDTYMAGALCPASFDLKLIPGKNHPDGMNSPGAEAEAEKYSCSQNRGDRIGIRPRCWFKPQLGTSDFQPRERTLGGSRFRNPATRRP
jgi:hypothetical protein